MKGDGVIRVDEFTARWYDREELSTADVVPQSERDQVATWRVLWLARREYISGPKTTPLGAQWQYLGQAP